MGAELVQKLLTTLAAAEWPETPIATAHGFQTYKVGLEKAMAFKGDPKDLAAALHTFRSGDSRPYAMAGAAYVLVKAARQKDGAYDPAGLDAAMSWLEQAQEMEPDKIAINMIEALIYAYHGRFDDARLVLDYLTQQESENQYLFLAEIAYWQQRGEVNEAVKWFQKAIENAVTVPERLQLRHQLGDYFMDTNHLDKALEVFQESIHFDRDNAGLWHKMSVIYWRKEEFEEAARCNQRALRIQDAPALRQMEKALKKKLDKGGLMGKLFGG